MWLKRSNEQIFFFFEVIVFFHLRVTFCYINHYWIILEIELGSLLRYVDQQQSFCSSLLLPTMHGSIVFFPSKKCVPKAAEKMWYHCTKQDGINCMKIKFYALFDLCMTYIQNHESFPDFTVLTWKYNFLQVLKVD